MKNLSLDITTLKAAYAAGTLTPSEGLVGGADVGYRVSPNGNFRQH